MEINKQEIIAKFGRKEGDTGSPGGSDCVAYGAHQSFDRTPQNTQKGPPQQTRSAQMVGQRRGLLDYLKANDLEKYRQIIVELDLRK